MDHVNIDDTISAANAACLVAHPLHIVQALIANDAMRIVQSDCVNVDDRRVSFPVPPNRPLSLPIFMFHVLIFERRVNLLNNNQSAFLAWDRRVEFGQSNRPLTTGQAAIVKTARFFDDLYGVHPLLAEAMTTGHSRLSAVIAVCIRTLRRCLYTATAIDNAVRKVVGTPWHVSTGTPFFQHLNDMLYGACITWKAVEYDPVAGMPCQTESTHANVPIVVDRCVGLVVTPTDKMLMVALLLFTEQFNLFLVCRGAEAAGLEAYGIPAPVITFIHTCTQVHRKPPDYYGSPPIPTRSEWDHV